MKQSLLQNSFMTLLLYVNNPKGVGINIKRSQLSKKVDIELQEISDKCIPVWYVARKLLTAVSQYITDNCVLCRGNGMYFAYSYF